jgi:hypothetical protein
MRAIVSHGGIMPPQGLTGNVGTKGLDPLSGKFRRLGRFFLLMAGPALTGKICLSRATSLLQVGAFSREGRKRRGYTNLIFARGSEYRPS